MIGHLFLYVLISVCLSHQPQCIVPMPDSFLRFVLPCVNKRRLRDFQESRFSCFLTRLSAFYTSPFRINHHPLPLLLDSSSSQSTNPWPPAPYDKNILKYISRITFSLRQPGCLIVSGDPWLSAPTSRRVWLFLKIQERFGSLTSNRTPPSLNAHDLNVEPNLIDYRQKINRVFSYFT